MRKCKDRLMKCFILSALIFMIMAGCKKEPETVDEFIIRGGKYLGEKKYTEAESDYYRALAREPNNIPALFGFALTKKLQKDYRLAKDFTNVGIRISSSSNILAPFYNLRGEINYEMGNKDSACIDFMQASNLGHKESVENQNKYCK